MSVLQQLYDSEINCGVQSDWDGGWLVWLGDARNRRIAEGRAANIAACDAWLREAALRHFPNSRFSLSRA